MTWEVTSSSGDKLVRESTTVYVTEDSYTKRTGQLDLYVNGKKAASVGVGDLKLNNRVGPLVLGNATLSHGGAWSGNLDGYMDHVKVFSYARDPSEVLADFESALRQLWGFEPTLGRL